MMRHTSWTSILRTCLAAIFFTAFFASGTPASADSREAAKAALAATVAVEWKETEGKQSPAPQLGEDVKGTYLWLDQQLPTAASFSSGTVVDADGLIVAFAAGTDEGETTVTLPDGQSLPAKRLVVDRRSQLALLKVDATGLDAITLGEGRPEVGESVLAAMCVDTKDRIVAKGIVAAAKRNVDGFPFPLIQTDIQVAPMSAGAPLVDESGELVGVIVAMMAPDAEKGGPALAVPTEKLRALLDAKAEDDSHVVIESGFLGIAITDHEGSPAVSSVNEDSPAAHVDIEQGDKIVAIDDHKIASAREVVGLIGGKMPGDVVALELERDGEPFKVRVRLGERPRPAETTSQSAGPEGASRYNLERVQPPKLYMLDKDGKLKTVDPQSGVPLLYPPAPQSGETFTWRNLAELQEAYADAIKNLEPPQTPVLRVERTELDQKLEALTGEVESLRQQVQILTLQLQELSAELAED